jgi:hypothetical protein
MNDWIMFFYNGETRVDSVLYYKQDELWPRKQYAITPHYGQVAASSIIETRKGEANNGTY